MSIVIDIKTRVFDDEDVAYRLFPGQGYRHFTAMKDHSLVFLDNPHIPLPGRTGYDKSDEMLQAIARSEEMQSLVNADGEDLEAQLREVRNKDFSSSRWGRKRELNLGWLNGLYHDAKLGDLIVVPSPGIIKNEEGEFEKAYTLVGEIVGDPEIWTNRGPGNLLQGRYVVRRVRWLANVNELELDPKVAVALRTQNALISMRARSFERVLGAAYKNIVIGEEFLARFVTDNPEFTAFENFHFNAFVMAVVAACRKVADEEQAWQNRQSIYDIAATVDGRDDLVPDQEASIHSPGYMTLRGAMLVPAVMSALFALALETNAQPIQQDGSGVDQVTVVNSESMAFDPCELGIEQSVRDTLNILGYERWLQIQNACQNASENEGLRSITTVTTQPDEE
ncbi:MAG: hypothetical protein ACU0DX_00250 [Roseovarius sp.]|uniref:hypothetical protein n=1 Tax=Roseovarius sp. TaxID=1486281 RepID=UPI004059385D